MAERLYAAKAGPIDPIALVGENVAVWYSANWHLYSVDYIEPMPKSSGMTFDLGAIAALGSIIDQRLQNLDQQKDPAGMIQLRFYPLDDIQITLKINRSEARFAAANVVATVDRYTEIADPCLHMTEFVIIQDRSAYVSCINPTNYALSMSRICFFGFRYVLKDFSVALPNKDAVRKLYPNVVYVDSSNY